MSISVGTKSLLFGVHAFWFHPIVVSLAWRRRYKKWPTFFESIAILVHDWGYWGCNDMDGPEGKNHPYRGADLIGPIICRFGATWEDVLEHHWLVLGHSRWMADLCKSKPSRLCNPDKESVLFEPRWFYLLRATLSGEIREYKAVAIRAGKISPFSTNREWFDYFRGRVLYRMVNTPLG